MSFRSPPRPRGWLRSPLAVALLAASLSPVARAQHAAGTAESTERIRRAQLDLARGDVEAAEGEFQAMANAEPGNAPAWANLGSLQYKRAAYQQAADSFARALHLEPKLWDARALLGLSESALNQRPEARADLDASFPHIHDPGVKLDAGLALLSLHAQDGTLSEATGIAAELERAAPANPEVLYAVYHVYSELAGKALETLKDHAPDSGRFHQILAEAALSQDNFPGAIAELRKAIALQPELPGVHLKLGTTLLINAQDPATIADARQAFQYELDHDANSAEALFELGETDRLSGQKSSAETLYRKALAIRPDYAEAHAALGSLLLEDAASDEALPHLVRATELSPANETFHYRLARLYQAMGRAEDARREMAIFQQLHRP